MNASVSGLIPPEVAIEEGRIEAVTGYVWPQELTHIATAVESRRREFAAGRILARRALARLGGGDWPILSGPDRAPVWPVGFTGSISHASGHVSVALGETDQVLAIGIDIEDISRFRPELERQILRPEEIALHLAGQPPDARQSALALLFSIKEAFYKCQYAMTHMYLGFHDANIRIDAARQMFEVTLLVPNLALPDTAFLGRYQVAGGAVAAALVLKANGRSWLE